jgi:hypothetical protein
MTTSPTQQERQSAARPTSGQLRIIRFERCVRGHLDGYVFAYCASDNTAAARIGEGLWSLDWWQRQRLVEPYTWWVDAEALTRLGRLVPELGAYLPHAVSPAAAANGNAAPRRGRPARNGVQLVRPELLGTPSSPATAPAPAQPTPAPVAAPTPRRRRRGKRRAATSAQAA